MSHDVVTTLSMEAGRISTLLWGTSLLQIVATFLAGWLLSRLLISAKHTAWRLGVDPSHRLRIVVRWGNLGIVMVLAGLLLRRLFDVAPMMTGLLAMAGAVGLMLTMVRPLQNAVSGASLILRGRIREGDHIELDGHTGTVREVSFLRLRVRDADGQTVLIPNRLLQDRVVTVSRKTHLVPIVAHIHLPTSDRHAVESARQAALLSPWRVPGTPVRAWMDGLALKVQLQTWSDGAVQPGRMALEQTLELQMALRSEAAG